MMLTSLARRSIDSSVIVCVFLPYAILSATAYGDLTAATFLGKIHNYQVQFSLQYQPFIKKILGLDQSNNFVLFSDVALIYLPLKTHLPALHSIPHTVVFLHH
jgi:hypothetical protein